MISDIRVLIVDDEQDILFTLKRYLRLEPYIIHLARNAAEAIRLCDEFNIAVIVTDLRMPEISGLELIEKLQQTYPLMVKVVLSGTEDIGMIIQTINSGRIFRFVPKPMVPDQLKAIIKDAVAFYRLQIEHKELTSLIEKQNSYLTRINDELQLMTTRLRESEVQFRTMNDAAFDPIFLLRRDGTIVYANHAAETLFGFSNQRLLSMRLPEIMSVGQVDDGVHLAMLDSSNITPKEWQINFVHDNGNVINTGTSVNIVDIRSIQHLMLIVRDRTLQIQEEKNRRELEKVQRTLESQIERRLLQSHAPRNLDGAVISHSMVSSGHLNGDFSDFIVYDERHADILLGDVMGHGILSALVGFGMKSLYLKTITQKSYLGNVPELTDVVEELQRLCIQDLLDIGIYTTMLFLRFDLQERVLSMIDCGHTASIHVHNATGAYTLLKGSNLPMGMVDRQEFQEFRIPFEENDTFVIYSDGITDARLSDGSFFGEARLISIVLDNRHLSPDALIGKIRQELVAATGGDTYDDDISCIVIRTGGSHG